MEYGEQVYRRIYGRGGLSDQLASAVGLRGALGDMTPEQSAAMQRMIHSRLTTPGSLQTFESQFINTPGVRTLIQNARASGDVGPVDCDCVISNIDADPTTLDQLRAACAQDPPTFGQTMAGQGISLECQPPWYEQPKNLMILGGAVGLGVVAWLVLR